MTFGDVLWTPPSDIRERSEVGRYLAWLEREDGRSFDGYNDLWRWSVDDLPGFWCSVWEHFGLGDPVDPDRVLTARTMPGATWFPDVVLSYPDRALRGPDERLAVVSVSHTRHDVRLTLGELRDQVARARTGLQRLGVGRGDRVVAYLPNIAETITAFLATASLGAIWASCAPEFGTASVVARFQQIEPKVLLTIDGYRYGAKAIDRHNEVAEIRAALPGLAATVVVPYLDAASVPGATTWAELVSEPGPLAFEQVPFDHPLYILYSSGTTGLPKPIVHGHGGILVEHAKALGLHKDIGAADRFFWYSTTGWMMWNFLVSGLVAGAAVVCFDGDPGWPDLGATWRMAAEQGVTSFGTSAPFLMACRKAGVAPGSDVDLSALRSVGSTGAPLPAEGFEWVYEAVRGDVVLSSISGGTDVCSAFVGGSVLLPVRSGVIAARCLGAAVEAFSPSGESLIGEQGELVITQPLPSMPVAFWGDDDSSRYRSAYFERFPGAWHHGDWITIAADGSSVITGRSDATLNRGGVRLGTSDFYTVVEAFDEVVDSLVVHLDDPDGGPGRLLLFVVPAPGAEVDDDLRARLGGALRTQLSPRHVPDELHAVAAVPRTLSGKKLEVPVKRILLGQPADAVASEDALADPRALDPYRALADAR
ncbi:MAG: acetoacetate--CoA ligase [Acidimicrobiales bacterium]|nr:acetoacetate--CoA ligase [Acidimicrobiales bacterium]